MFNRLPFKMIKPTYVFLCFLFFFSCKDEVKLSFSETNFLEEQETIVEVNIPSAEGNTEASKSINKTLQDFACSVLNIDASNDKKETVKESITAFNNAYKSFREALIKEFDTDFPKWEALIDGEVSYLNEAIVSIAMNGSINTGSASSNLVFKFYNFDVTNGNVLTTKELVNDMDRFTTLVKKYYDKEILTTSNSLNKSTVNFKLPETLGFSDDGVIILYDNFEFGNFTKELIEFTIPYEVANKYLNF